MARNQLFAFVPKAAISREPERELRPVHEGLFVGEKLRGGDQPRTRKGIETLRRARPEPGVGPRAAISREPERELRPFLTSNVRMFLPAAAISREPERELRLPTQTSANPGRSASSGDQPRTRKGIETVRFGGRVDHLDHGHAAISREPERELRLALEHPARLARVLAAISREPERELRLLRVLNRVRVGTRVRRSAANPKGN